MKDQIHVLLIEDNPSDARMVKGMLEHDSNRVFAFQHASTLQGGIRSLGAGSGIQIILLDLGLPDETGLQTLRRIMPLAQDASVVVFTGTEDEELGVAAIREGAHDYLVKGQVDGNQLRRIIRNALERHRMQVELRAEMEARRVDETRHRALFEYAPDGIIIADPQSKYLDANSSMCRMLGYTRDELIGLDASDIVAHEEIPQIRQALTAIKIDSEYHREWQFRRKDGSVFSADVMATMMPDGNLLGLIRDVTDRKKMEHQLRIAQRTEAIGRLAGGVAHDFNNLLAIILGCSDLLLEEIPPEDPASRRAKMIRKAAASAADLTRQLLAFSRQQMLQPQVLDLKEVVGKAQILLGRLIGENIEFTVSLEPSLWKVKADPGQIEQVLLNLAVNARDAMPQGGRLAIEARNVELDASYVQEHQPVIAGPYVMLLVQDTGSGMDKQTQSRIFDPFFTTKELGKGTGLGLATVYGIVKQSGGYVWVYSELGQGTVFKVYLPCVQPCAEDEALPVKYLEPEEETARGSETILLAEDAAWLREMTREYLESLGYTVLEAASGVEALDLAKNFSGTIHLLLTDVIMPQMSGPELAQQIRPLRPGIKVIFTSGYTDDTMARHGVLDSVFIQKPFRPKALARTIKETLHAHEPEPETNLAPATDARDPTPV